MSIHRSLMGDKDQGRVVALADAGAVLIGLEGSEVSVPAESEEAASVASGAAAVPPKLPHLPAERLGELSGRTLGHFKIGWLLARGHCPVL